MIYCRYGLGFIPRLMPVERQQGWLINRSREWCAKHRVVITHAHIIEKQKKIECYTEISLHYVQLVVHSWPRSNIRSTIQFAHTSLWCSSRTTDVTVDFHLFTSNSKIRCWPKITCYIWIFSIWVLIEIFPIWVLNDTHAFQRYLQTLI